MGCVHASHREHLRSTALHAREKEMAVSKHPLMWPAPDIEGLSPTGSDGWPESMVVDAGAFLFRAGDPVDAVTWITDGLVTLVRQDDATRDLPVGLCGAGRILGAIGAMEQQRHHVSAVALVPTHVSRMPAPLFRDRLETSRDFLQFATVAIDREVQTSLEDSIARVPPHAGQTPDRNPPQSRQRHAGAWRPWSGSGAGSGAASGRRRRAARRSSLCLA